MSNPDENIVTSKIDSELVPLLEFLLCYIGSRRGVLDQFRHPKLDYFAEACVICSEGMLHLCNFPGLVFVDMSRTRQTRRTMSMDLNEYTEGSSESRVPYSLCINNTPSSYLLLFISAPTLDHPYLTSYRINIQG